MEAFTVTDGIIALITGALGFIFGMAHGRWYGFLDAQPRRDKRGRFIRRK